MTWIRGPLVWGPDGRRPWARHSALQPTPLVDERTRRIRVYCGVRDGDGRSSIGWVDLDLDNPTSVLGQSDEPVLAPDIGSGAWDRDGVVPTSIVRAGGELRLYYAGYERIDDPLVRFKVFSGLAVSYDDGANFERWGVDGQLLRPVDEAPLFRVIHSILPTPDGRWRAWYGGGSEFLHGATKSLPVYDVRCMISDDGLTFPDHGEVVLGQGEGEYRVGRPYVVDRGDAHLEMFFGASTARSTYRLGYASSVDAGATWRRADETLGELAQPGSWDAGMSAYPAVVEAPGGRVMLYDGDDYGRAGFGLAREIA